MSSRGIFGMKRRGPDSRVGDTRSAVSGRASHVTAATSKRLTYDAAGTRLLKVAVVFLCSVNALMWEYYTQSRMMAILWAAIAVAFVVWIVDDMRR
jgi:hypothetical protein